MQTSRTNFSSHLDNWIKKIDSDFKNHVIESKKQDFISKVSNYINSCKKILGNERKISKTIHQAILNFNNIVKLSPSEFSQLSKSIDIIYFKAYDEQKRVGKVVSAKSKEIPISFIRARNSKKFSHAHHIFFKFDLFIKLLESNRNNAIKQFMCWAQTKTQVNNDVINKIYCHLINYDFEMAVEIAFACIGNNLNTACKHIARNAFTIFLDIDAKNRFKSLNIFQLAMLCASRNENKQDFSEERQNIILKTFTLFFRIIASKKQFNFQSNVKIHWLLDFSLAFKGLENKASRIIIPHTFELLLTYDKDTNFEKNYSQKLIRELVSTNPETIKFIKEAFRKFLIYHPENAIGLLQQHQADPQRILELALIDRENDKINFFVILHALKYLFVYDKKLGYATKFTLQLVWNYIHKADLNSQRFIAQAYKIFLKFHANSAKWILNNCKTEMFSHLLNIKKTAKRKNQIFL